MEARSRKRLITLGKIVFSGLLLYFIFTKIPFQDAWTEIKRAMSASFLIALLLFILSKLLAAVRLNLFFHHIGVPLSAKSNFKLYLQGMFYNLFLPGGIGGDAYKGFVIKKLFGVETRKVISSLLIDRISGLVLIIFFSVLFAIFLQVSSHVLINVGIVTALVAGLLLFWWLINRFFSYLQPVFWTSLGYSALVQLAQIAAVWFLLQAFGITEKNTAYLLVFLISSIVAILPITIGGIGSREVVFYYGASWMGLQQEVAVSVSILFFAITAIVSLTGMYYHFKKPELEVADLKT